MTRPFYKKKYQLMLLLVFLVFNSCGEKEDHDISYNVPRVISIIEENKAYRSPQLTGQEFTEAIKRYGFKTIINLRGEKSEKTWYIEEKKAVESAGIAHINIRMSPSRFPHRKDLLKLLDTFKTAQRPILIHCRRGADRTGEASAIYQMIYMGKSREDALNMLTLKYCHDSTNFPNKRYFIKNVWQGQQWAYSTYDPCVQNYKYYDQNRYCDQ